MSNPREQTPNPWGEGADYNAISFERALFDVAEELGGEELTNAIRQNLLLRDKLGPDEEIVDMLGSIYPAAEGAILIRAMDIQVEQRSLTRNNNWKTLGRMFVRAAGNVAWVFLPIGPPRE